MGYGLHAAFSALGEAPGSFAADQMGLHIAHAAAEGAVGGGISEFTGGNFKDGFIGAGTSAFLTPFSSRLGLGPAGTGGIGRVAARTAVAATIGGTASALSGGKFANGAISAGFMHLFNQEAGKYLGKKFFQMSNRFLNNRWDPRPRLDGRYWGPDGPNSYFQCGNGAQYWCGTKAGGEWHDAPQTPTWSAGPNPLSDDFVALRQQAIDNGGSGYLMLATGWDPEGHYINRDIQDGFGNHTIVYLGTDVADPANYHWVYHQYLDAPAHALRVPTAWIEPYRLVLSSESFATNSRSVSLSRNGFTP